MVDILTPPQRSELMSRIRSRNTKPELAVRSLLHGMGFRFRLHREDLPGRPDIVLPKYKTVVQVHGCFWHRHDGCRFAYDPKTRAEFWQQKFLGNVERDRRTTLELERLDWRVVVVWECELRKVEELAGRLETELRE